MSKSTDSSQFDGHQIGLIAKALIFDALNFALIVGLLVSYLSPLVSEDDFQLARNVLYALILAAVGALLSWILRRKRTFTLGHILFQSQVDQSHAPAFFRSLFGWQLLLTLLLAVLVGARQTTLSIFELLDEDGFSSARTLVVGLFNPEWKILPLAVFKVIETIYIALIATLLAVPAAFMLAFFAAKNLMTSPLSFAIYSLLRTVLNVVRSVEPIIWAIVFAVWVGVGPFAGMLALMIQSIASLTKQYSELIESALPGPVDSIAATGANPVQVVWYGIVPQVMLPYVSFTIYRWDTNVRMATIIGFAGGGGIGTILYQYSMRAQWPQVSCLILVIAVVVWLLDTASAYLREALK